MLKCFFVFSNIFFAGVIFSQNISDRGIPAIKSYNNEIVTAGKIWEIQQAPNGILYMAGDVGLLEFDGLNWTKFKGSAGFTRSVCVANDSVIYTGSDLDFGVWKKTKKGFVYESIYPFKQDTHGLIEEFWHTYLLDDAVVFHSFQNIYLFKNQQLTKIPAPHKFYNSFKSNNRLIFADEKLGLFEFNGVEVNKLAEYPIDIPLEVIGISENGNELKLFTRNHGVFQLINNEIIPLPWEINKDLKRDQLFSFTQINNELFVLGSILNGLYIIDSQANVIQHINKKKGLLHNTVLDVFADKNQNLWLSMDYGISKINLNSEFTYYIDYTGNFGTAETAYLTENIFLLGTNQGLYKTAWNNLKNNPQNTDLQLVINSEGQVWNIKKIDETVLVGHDNGLFLWENEALNLIYEEPGILDMVLWDTTYLLTGSYNGIEIFKKSNNSWEFIRKVRDISGACKQLLVDKNKSIWVNIPNYGIVNFKLNENLETYDIQNFNLNKINLNEANMYFENDTLKIATKTDIIAYDSNDSTFNKINPHKKINYPNHSISSKTQKIQIDSHYIFYPILNGFSFQNKNINLVKTNAHKPMIFSAFAYNNQQQIALDSLSKIPYNSNNIKFNFTIPLAENAHYIYYLKNGEKIISETTQNNSVDFLSLNEGNYSFWVENADDKNQKSTVLKFSIQAPWYRSWLAYFFYFLSVIGIFLFVRYFQNLNLKKQRKEMLKKEQLSLREQAEKHKEKLLQNQQEQMILERKALEDKVKDKTMELAKSAKENKDKNRILHFIKEKLDEIEKDPTSTKAKLRLAEIRRILNDNFFEDDQIF